MKKYTSHALIFTIGLFLSTSVIPVKAGGPHAINTGWAIDNNGNPLLTSSVLGQMVSPEKTGWLRLGMRLIPGHTNWDSTILGYYDTVVNDAISKGLSVFILVNNESWNGSQSSWDANSYECAAGNGDNGYIDGFVTGAFAPILTHFHDRVKVYEIWNEPSTWSSQNGNCYSGSSFMYPSCFSCLLNKCWVNAHITQTFGDVTILSGGIFGTSSQGAGDPYGNSGASWLNSVYDMGINHVGWFSSCKSSYGSYPLDGIGQHIYIDYNTTTSSANFQEYENEIHSVYTNWEGANTSKKTWITEFGWSTANVSQSVQDQNMNISYTVIQEQGSYVKMGAWFEWQDNPSANLYFGILDSSGNPKTCYNDFAFWQQYEGYYINGTLDNNVLNYFNARGQPVMGNAYDNGGTAFVHSWGGANVQDYAGGSGSDKTVFDDSFGTFEVNDINGFRNFYIQTGGPGKFGVPKNNEYSITGGTRQDFANGSLSQTGSGVRWSGSLNGLYAQYYNGTNFNMHVLDKVDSTVNFNWTAPPVPGCGLNVFSVNWTGFVTPLYSQTYTFYTQSDDGVRLWVNGVELVNDWTIHGSKQDSGTIALTAGQKYSIQLQYFQNYGGAVAQLSWSSPSQTKQIIPSSQLLPY